MNSIKLLFIPIAVILVSACVTTDATMLSSKSYPPIDPSEVTIYLSEDDIEGDYEKIAIINARGSASYTSESQMYEAVRKKAAEMGANGILHAKLEEPSSGAKVAAAFVGVDTTRRGEMIAIYVYDE